MPATAKSFGDFARDVLALYGPRMRRSTTRAKMRQILDEFGAICATTEDLTPGSIARWIEIHAGEARRPATLISLLRTLRAACSYAVRTGSLEQSPFSFRRPEAWIDRDTPDLEPPVHSAAEIARALGRVDLELREEDRDGPLWLRARLRAVVYTAAYTGARKNEILGLRTADVDLDRAVLAIRPNDRRRLKTRASAADLPVPEKLAAVLRDWSGQCDSEWLFPAKRRQTPWLNGPYGERAIDELKALGLRCGVADLTFQSFRHTFASLAESWGIGELMLQRLLRHASARTQLGYRHPLSDAIREAGGKIRFP